MTEREGIKCGSCGAPLKVSDARCEYCGTYYDVHVKGSMRILRSGTFTSGGTLTIDGDLVIGAGAVLEIPVNSQAGVVLK